MSPRIHALFGAQHGLIEFRQAVEAGLSPRQIAALLRSGTWLRVHAGVYIERERWDELDVYVGRRLLKVRAAHLVVKVPHWFSHDSAALVHGIGMIDIGRDPELVHVTRTDMRGRRSTSAITHHGAKIHSGEAMIADGLPVLSPARTAIDLAREHVFDIGLGACDHVLRQGLTRAELLAVAERMRGWPFSRKVAEVIELADPGAENAFESAGRSLVLELGIGVPQTQFGLRDAGRTVYCDIRVGRHIFEADGQVKLIPRSEGGYADDAEPRKALWAAKKRQDFVCGFKTGMSHITHADLGSGRAAARQRLRREYDDTVARFGSSIEDLAPYLVRRPLP